MRFSFVLPILALAWGSTLAQGTPPPPTAAPSKVGYHPSPAEAELIHCSSDWMEAMLRHDRVRLEALMAPEYVLHAWDGPVPDTHRAAWLDSLFNHLKIDVWEQTAVSARLYGEVGVVTSKFGWAGAFHGKTFDAKGFLTDVWLRRDSRWQVVSRTSGPLPGNKTLAEVQYK